MDIGKLLALGAAGYIGYKYFFSPQAAPSSNAPVGGIMPADSVAADPLTTRSMVLAEANRNNFKLGTVAQWNYYYGAVRGIPAPDFGRTPEQQPEILTFDEWWNLASSHGLHGLSAPNYGRSPEHAALVALTNRARNWPAAGYVRGRSM